MIPLLWALGIWLILVVIFCFLALLTTMLLIRFGLAGIGTYIASAFFLGMTIVVLLSVGGYLLTVDWSQSISLFPTAPTDSLLFP